MNICSKLIIILTLLIAIVSCTDINSWGDSSRTPSLKASFIYFPKSQIELGGTDNLSTTVQLQAVSTPWRILNPASEWLTVSPTEGAGDETITFAAKENPTSDNIRTAVLSLESADVDYAFSRPLTVNQSKANSVLAPDAHSIEFTRESQKRTVDVIANTDWSASCPADWIHLNKVSATSLEILVEENNGTTDRTTQIDFTGSSSSSISILQHGYQFDVLMSEMHFDSSSSSQTLSIQTDGVWTAETKEWWLHASPMAGSRYSNITVSVENNENIIDRTGTISLSVGDVTKYVFVTQKGNYIDIETSPNIVIPSTGGSRTITFSTLEEWNVDCKNTSWVSVDKTNGYSGDNIITLTFQKNTQETSRTDTTFIRIKNVNLPSIRIITSQEGTPKNGFENGHEYVDLGLPSGTLWATMNIGAKSPEGTGLYFAWGETYGYESGRRYFALTNYKWFNWEEYQSTKEYNQYTKYCTDSSYGVVDNKIELEIEDDAARQNWGGTWRMPSLDQIDELINECTSEWVCINGQNGRKITSKHNGNSIFVPAVGLCNGYRLDEENLTGYYLSRYLGYYTDSSGILYHTSTVSYLFVEQAGVGRSFGQRCWGHVIRPVFCK